MEAKPEISVLMPVYNCEAYILDAVNSILNQSFQDFEFIIIDDASTDATVNIIKNLKDNRIQLIEKPINTGYTNSLNHGLEIAKGKYIARMDGDDISMPERFAAQFNFLEKNEDVVVCGTKYSIIDSSKIINVPKNDEDIKIAMLNACAIAHPSVMIRKAIIDDNQIKYKREKEPAEDYDLWANLMRYGKLHNLQDILLKYRVHNMQISNTKHEQQQESAISTKIKLLKYAYKSMTIDEEENLKSIIKKDARSFFEIQKYIKTKKQILSNNTFFKSKGLLSYLNNLEKKTIENYLMRRKKFSPKTFKEYKQLKKDLSYKLSPIEELKLFVKSSISYTYK